MRSVSLANMVVFMLGGEHCMLMHFHQGILNKTLQLLSWIYVSSWAITIRSCQHGCYAIGRSCVVMSWTDELILKNYKVSWTTTPVHAYLFMVSLWTFVHHLCGSLKYLLLSNPSFMWNYCTSNDYNFSIFIHLLLLV